MANRLDILALEPFCGGPRKAMLEAILRYSRHHWMLLRLPPRRIERRLAAAAIWFSEQLSRHWMGPVDVLFTSEALNLDDFFKLTPSLAHKPAVVYFHDNQLPDADAPSEQDTALAVVNVTTALAATEIWFNSLYHLQTFLKRASALIHRHAELAGRDPLPQIASRAQLVRPPIDLDALHRAESEPIERDPRLLFVDTRNADVPLLNRALLGLQRRGEKFSLVTTGPVDGLDADLPRVTIPEDDMLARAWAMRRASVIVSGKPGAPADYDAVAAMMAGCWPVFPDTGVYPELLPQPMHHICLYRGSAVEMLVNRLQDVWWIERPHGYQEQVQRILRPFEARAACAEMDDRLEQLVLSHSVRTSLAGQAPQEPKTPPQKS